MRKIILVFAFFSLICSPALATETAPPKLLNIQEIKSAGGITAWLVEDHTVPVISLQFAFKDLGSAQDPADKQGLFRMLSNTMDEGAGELTSEMFQKELQDLSISLSYQVGRDDFSGIVKTLTKNKDRAFELLKLSLTKPRFDQEPVDRMREANQSRIRTSLSDPQWIAARILNDRAFAGHPYSNNSGGTLSSLEKITPDDLRVAHSLLSQDRLVVTVTGDISAEQLSELLDQVFGQLPQTSARQSAADFSLQNQGKTFFYKKDIPQTVIEILQSGIDRKDPDYPAAQVMNFILGSSGFGSRLTRTIREDRGLTYGIYSSLQDMEHVDYMGVSTSTKNESAKEMIDLIRAEWRKMKTEPVTQKELDDAKSYLIGSLPLSMTSTDEITSLMMSLNLNGLPIDYLDQRQEKIRNLTIQDIQNIAGRLLDETQFMTVMVGNPQNLNSFENLETIKDIPNAE